MHAEHMFGNSYELSICCFRRLFKSYSKSKEIFSEYKVANKVLWAIRGGVMNSSYFFLSYIEPCADFLNVIMVIFVGPGLYEKLFCWND